MPSPTIRRSALALTILVSAFLTMSCGADTPAAPPALTSLIVTLSTATLVPGQPATAAVAGKDQNGTDFAVSGTPVWSSTAPAVATVTAAGVVAAVSPGTSQITVTMGALSAQSAVTVTASPGVKINEVESNGGTPGDWIELYNPTAAAIDISGWGVRDNDTTHAIYKFPAGTTIAAGAYFMAEEAQFGFGLGAPDEARLYNQYGVAVDIYGWTAHATTTYGRCANGTGPFVTTTTSTKAAANDCTPTVRINEVESSGGTPADWVELYNFGTNAVNVGGFLIKNLNDAKSYTIPANTSIAAGSFLVIDEASLGYGLSSTDAVRLFDGAGALLDSYTWATDAGVTYGRCPDGTGALINTSASTKGGANACNSTSTSAWPGLDDVTTVDGLNVFGGNLSGLVYEPASGANPAVLWGARNGPGAIFRLIFNGTIWTPDVANGWTTGKALRYPDGTGDPDTEDVTFTSGSAAGLYTIAERNNSSNGTSRNSILRFDATSVATILTATNEWNVTADLPATGANLGIEAVTWIPDAFLVARGFVDESKNAAYNPANYPNHGSGLFFVGVEANGIIYAYALDHSTNGFTRIATFATGFPAGVMSLQYDRDFNYLWAECDDGCSGLTATFEINTTAGSSSFGKFQKTRQFNRPSSMPNINNEGFAVETNAACVAGKKFVYWADDSETGGHAIRRATLSCTALP